MPEQEFILEDTKLTVSAALETGREDELRQYCARLLDRPEAELTVDLSAVEYIHSLSIGVLSYAWVEALSRDKELTFLVSQPVASVLERTGLSKVFSYKLVESGE